MRKFIKNTFIFIKSPTIYQILFVISFISFTIYELYIYYNLNISNLIFMINDSDSDSDKAKGVLEINNIKITGFEFAMEHIRDGAI
jgi:hypothetical protein